mgnify:CR=1 FL=1
MAEALCLTRTSSTTSRMVNYHMSSVFPDKKTKDAIMNNISSGILNDINIEKTGA